MITLTNRPSLQTTLAHRKTWVFAREQKFLKTVGELEHYGREAANTIRRHHMLVVDLELIAGDAESIRGLIAWLLLHPWTHPVMVMSMTRIRDQIAAFGIVKTEFSHSSLIHIDDVIHNTTWESIHRAAMARVQAPAVRETLVRWAAERERVFAAEELVLRMLALAPQMQRVEQLALALGRCRKTLWAELEEAGQMGPKEMLLVFHLVYAVRMRTVLGWTLDVIARYLGYANGSRMMRCFSRKLEVSATVFFERPADQVFMWAAETLSSKPCGNRACVERKLTLRQHAERFVRGMRVVRSKRAVKKLGNKLSQTETK